MLDACRSTRLAVQNDRGGALEPPWRRKLLDGRRSSLPWSGNALEKCHTSPQLRSAGFSYARNGRSESAYDAQGHASICMRMLYIETPAQQLFHILFTRAMQKIRRDYKMKEKLSTAFEMRYSPFEVKAMTRENERLLDMECLQFENTKLLFGVR